MKGLMLAPGSNCCSITMCARRVETSDMLQPQSATDKEGREKLIYFKYIAITASHICELGCMVQNFEFKRHLHETEMWKKRRQRMCGGSPRPRTFLILYHHLIGTSGHQKTSSHKTSWEWRTLRPLRLPNHVNTPIKPSFMSSKLIPQMIHIHFCSIYHDSSHCYTLLPPGLFLQKTK